MVEQTRSIFLRGERRSSAAESLHAPLFASFIPLPLWVTHGQCFRFVASRNDMGHLCDVNRSLAPSFSPIYSCFLSVSLEIGLD